MAENKRSELPSLKSPAAGDLLGWNEYRPIRSESLRRLFALAAPLILSTRTKSAEFDRLEYVEWRKKRADELYDIRMIKVSFVASRPEGGVERQSGLLLLPELKGGETRDVGWVVFMKGSEFRKKEVPSRRRSVELPFAASLAALGYAVWAPDYAGMGEGEGVQEYCVPDSLADSGAQGLTAARNWMALRRASKCDSGYGETGRLAVMGYSEGGTAAMAFLDSIARGRSSVPGLSLTVGYPMGALLDLRAIEPVRGETPAVLPHPAFLIYIVMGWARAYPNEVRIQDVLSPRVVEKLVPLFDGRRSVDRLDAWIARTFKRKKGEVLDTDVFAPEYLTGLRENPDRVPYCRMQMERRLDRRIPPGLPVILAATPKDEVVPFPNSAAAVAWAREHVPGSDVKLVELAGPDHLMGGIEALLYAIVDLDQREASIR